MKTFEEEFGKIEHDAAQSKFWKEVWNTFPEVRPLWFMVNNEVHRRKGEADKEYMIRLSLMKAKGLRAGVLDLMLIWHKETFAFDIKINKDFLSDKQKEFIFALQSRGGNGWEVRGMEQGLEIIKSIIENKWKTNTVATNQPYL